MPRRHSIVTKLSVAVIAIVTLMMTRNNESIVVEIRDNGIGVDEETRANIFRPFSSMKEELGTGLGLSLTSRIVKLHGGEIDVECGAREGLRTPHGPSGGGKKHEPRSVRWARKSWSSMTTRMLSGLCP